MRYRSYLACKFAPYKKHSLQYYNFPPLELPVSCFSVTSADLATNPRTSVRARLLNLVLIRTKMSAKSSTFIGYGVHPYKTSSVLENSSWLTRATSGVGVPVTHSQLSLGKSLQQKSLPCFSKPG